MSFSRIQVAAAALLLLGATAGCAHSLAPPAASPAAEAPPTGAPQTARQAVLDPSEEITPEELSTLPEPVPAKDGGGTEDGPRAPLPVAQRAPRAGSRAPQGGAEEEGQVWRVQIFATQDRVLADRMAGEAGVLLQAAVYVAHEAPFYKVRVGDYLSEQEAAPLRDKAVRSGFPGAFRIRCSPEATHRLE
jgi:hypothetical protein